MMAVDLLEPIALVGIAAQLPSGPYSSQNLSNETFFQFLLDEGQAYEVIPSDRFTVKSWKGTGTGKIMTDTGAFLKDNSLFDPVEFGISTKDVRAMSLSTRKLIELSFLALLDSGIHYRGQRVGCYTSGIPYDILSVADADEFEARGSFAGGPCMIANKVSYHLDLLGPSIPVDTACSSSLVALHMAMQALRAGDCRAAVVGGCQLNHRLIDWIQYSQGGILAPDGKCKPFDISANGFARGEGVVVIVVKLLKDAVRDGDHIYATVLGTGVTTNGCAAPAHAPVAEAQAQAMEYAYHRIGRNPKDIDFIELHATGTAAGDPTEANWVGNKFCRKDELLIGSVKGNVGHLEIAAFLTSLIKVCAMFSAKTIPPNVNIHSRNPAIKWDEFRMRAVTTKTPLPLHQVSGLHLVSMTSSGIGGVNGHAVIESPPLPLVDPPATQATIESPTLLISSGLSPRSSLAISSSLLDNVADSQTDLRRLSTLFGRRARQMSWRSFAIIASDRSVIQSFEQPQFSPRASRPIVFVFSGQGTQYFEMGKQLFHTLPVFQTAILHLDSIYRHVTGSSLIERTGLFSDKSTSLNPSTSIWPIALTIPALCMIQMALCDTLKAMGVTPDIVIGHSAGETPLLYGSGAATAQMTLELAIARATGISVAESAVNGSMAALDCTVEQAKKVIGQILSESTLATETLEIACYNSHDSVTVSGHGSAIDRLVDLAQELGFFCRKLRTRVAVHSALMEPCRKTYNELVDDVFRRYKEEVVTPKTPVYSSYTGGLYSGKMNARYFWDQTRHPVRFADAISQLVTDNPHPILLEIGPHPALTSYLNAASINANSVLYLMKRPKTSIKHHEMSVFLNCLGNLVVLGYNFVNFCALNVNKFEPHSLNIPPYPFAKKHCPYTPEYTATLTRAFATHNGPLNSPSLRMNTATHPTIAQHVIRGEPIMPAAGFLEMAFEFGATILWNVTFLSMMSIPTDKILNVELTIEKSFWSVKSRLTPTSSLRLHAHGYLSNESCPAPSPLNLSVIQDRCQPFPTHRFYSTLEYFASYGPLFQRIRKCWKGSDEVLVQVQGASQDLFDFTEYVMHPAILDACFHAMVHPAFTGNADRNTYYLPSRIASVNNYLSAKGTVPETVFAYITFRLWRPDGMIFDIVVTDDNGQFLCTLTGFEVAAHDTFPLPTVQQRYDLLYQPHAIPPMSKQLGTSIREIQLSDLAAFAPYALDAGYHLWHWDSDLLLGFQALYNYVTITKRSIRVLDCLRDISISLKLRQDVSQNPEICCAYDLLLSPSSSVNYADMEMFTRVITSI